jgi:predicted  nucleic acid-binding Zn-ribbon protein
MEMASLRRHSAEEIARLSDRLARVEGEVHERRQEVGVLEGRLRDERERRRRAEEALSVRGGGKAGR